MGCNFTSKWSELEIMRAIYIDDFILNDTSDVTTIDGEKAHHLIKVVRIKEQQEILILNGKGSKWLATVDKVAKKSLEISVKQTFENIENTNNIHIAIALLKKEAMDLALKQAVELGIRKISIIVTENSQRYSINAERNEKILGLALEQSNGLYLPKVEYVTLDEVIDNVDNQIIYLSSIDGGSEFSIKRTERVTLLIGPEAGMTISEENKLAELKNTVTVKFPTNILRAPTALSTGYGYLLGKMID